MQGQVTPRTMMLGDVVQPENVADLPWTTGTVVGLDKDTVSIFRPYVHHDNTFASGSLEPGQGTILHYLGMEEYKESRESNRPYRLLAREPKPIR